jgi:hypothetical protein
LVSDRDDRLWKLWAALLGLAIVTGLALRLLKKTESTGSELGWRLAPLFPLAAVAYFVAPTGYDWIWPISARFPLIALLFACLLVLPLRSWFGQLVWRLRCSASSRWRRPSRRSSAKKSASSTRRSR